MPAWIPILALLFSGAWLLGGLEGDADLAGFTFVDPRRTRIEGASGFVDPRWRPALAARLAALPEVSSLDPACIEQLRAALLSLPFVAEVGECSVIWPDGCDLSVRLRKPVACIRSGTGFLAVSEDAVVLPGEWTRPPWIEGGWLPVVGGPDRDQGRAQGGASDDAPGCASEPAASQARPGERLAGRTFLDGLAVAASMRRALSDQDFETMGAPWIDASRSTSASAEDPGVVLRLEGGRTVYFGRAPNAGEPGELPEDRKWAALARGLRALRVSTADARDWALLDVRWDVPDVLWRDAGAQVGELPSRGG